MKQIPLGKSGVLVSRSGFGAIPIQRINTDQAVCIVRKALDYGITFFDTARAYTDSEIKLGHALGNDRHNVVIATKSGSTDPEKIIEDVETSLRNLQTDYIDIFQFHNPGCLQDVIKSGGVYEVILKAKEQGKIRHIGITNHKLTVAREALKCGLFETIQYPFNHLSSDDEVQFVNECRANDIGFIGMKALSGGLITNAATSYAFLSQYENVVPVWGIQKECELDEIAGFESNPPALDNAMIDRIQKDRKELGGSFCRGCGYCLPCPAKIPVPTAARIAFLLKRTVYEMFLEDEFKNEMLKINNCTNCGNCRSRCPYELDTPKLLKSMLGEYEQFYFEKTGTRVT